MGNTASSLSVTELDGIVESTRHSVDVKTLREWEKKFYKAFPNGKFSVKQFNEACARRFLFGNPEMVFKAIDTDHDGFVDFKEFMVGLCITHTFPLEERLELAFKIYDTNDNGNLETNEMEVFINTICKILGRKDEEDTMTMRDCVYASISGPGTSERINTSVQVSLGDFRKAVMENEAICSTFKRYDGMIEKKPKRI